MRNLLCLVCVFVPLALSLGTDERVVIRVSGCNEKYLGIVASFGRDVAKSPQLKGSLSIASPADASALGCVPWSATLPKKERFVAMVNRGNCTFLEKTMYAQKAGAVALIVVSQDETIVPMSAPESDIEGKGGRQNIIPCVMVARSLREAMNEHSDSLSLETYEPRVWDPMMIFIIATATAIVGLGAYYSCDAERSRALGRGASFRQRHETQEIDATMAMSFVLVASAGLLLMFFFVQYLFKFVLFIFVCGAVNGLSLLASHGVEYFWPNLALSMWTLTFPWPKQYRASDVVAFVPALLVSLTWYWYRLTSWAWLLQDAMCVGLLLVVQRAVRLPSMRVSTILLGTAFVYDIFWVFLSPFFFTRSVMVEVATYTHENARDSLPVALKFPKLMDPFHGPMILGLGDIALPGLLVSLMLRYDYVVGNTFQNGYFVRCLCGYALGLCLTDVSLVAMSHGQPALLYLVPCTLGLVLYRSYRRGELRALWHWDGTHNATKYALVPVADGDMDPKRGQGQGQEEEEEEEGNQSDTL